MTFREADREEPIQMSVDSSIALSGDARIPALSPREIEVLLTWFAFDSKGEAAATLYISQATVNTHITRIRSKYVLVGRPARTKSQLLARAIQDGFTRIDDW